MTAATLAAVDLGSNSFKLVVAEDAGGSLRRIDRLRERVGLAEGLEDDGGLDDGVAERALGCLRRFRQRLGSTPPGNVRAVGTATFRRLAEGPFLARAQEALGHEIEVLPGREEARLVYLGVAHSLGDDAGRRLVIDIGGASTECVLGRRFESERERSLSMGCVRWSLRFFPDGKFSRKRMERAELAARIELEPIEREFRELGWESCVGSSGTILAVAEILERQGWGTGTVTPRGLSKLTDAIVDAGSVAELTLEGLKDERRPVLAGGVAVLRAVFAGLGVLDMHPARGALREGLLYDLLGRIHHEDVRWRSVVDFARRFGVDGDQVARVRDTALLLFDASEGAWGLTPADRRLLAWAVETHEVGLAVSWLAYHKHGAYLVQNADLPGFSRERRDRLAWLVRTHRRRITPALLELLPESSTEGTLRLAVLLRLAVRLHRNRGTLESPVVAVEATDRGLRLEFPKGWLEGHPLTHAELRDEAELMLPLGFTIEA